LVCLRRRSCVNHVYPILSLLIITSWHLGKTNVSQWCVEDLISLNFLCWVGRRFCHWSSVCITPLISWSEYICTWIEIGELPVLLAPISVMFLQRNIIELLLLSQFVKIISNYNAQRVHAFEIIFELNCFKQFTKFTK